MKNISNHLSHWFFGLVCFSYLVLMLSQISIAYLDFGDGNYLYISRRLTQGLVIYKDILSPQPPFHLFLGAILLKTGDLLGNPLFLIRVFTICLRISHAVLIYLIAGKLFLSDDRSPISSWIPALSGIVYLFLPIGFWWSRGYQSEPLEILWMLLAFYYFIQFDRRKMIYAGLLGSFAVLTNMTGVPYLLLSVIYLGIFRRDLFLRYLLPAILVIVLSVIVLQLYTTGMFLQNTIIDQVGTYPKEDTLNYMLGKIRWIGGIIIGLEGFLIFASLVGLFLYIKGFKNWKNETRNLKFYIFLYMLSTLGSFVFATKGGTVDYIFTLGEPAVALFSVYAVYELIRFMMTKIPKIQTVNPGLMILIFLLILVFLSIPGIRQNINTLRGINYELSPDQVNEVLNWIKKTSSPKDRIFAPPYFAFLSERKIVGEFSEQYVWFMKYLNWILYREGNPNTIIHIEKIGNELSNKKIPIVFLNIERGRGQQTGMILPIRQAVNDQYDPAGQIRMRNETLTVFLPRD